MGKRRAYCLLLNALGLVATFATAAYAAEPIELARGTGLKNPQQPQVAVGQDGVIHVVYGIDNKVYYHRSTDGGNQFSMAKELSFAHAMSLGMRRGPRIAVTADAICISAIGGKQGKGRDGDLLVLRSADDGKTWESPAQVNDVDGSAREGLHAMAAGPKGEICCVWLDLRNQSTEIMASVSHDGGASWGKNTLVYKSPSDSVCECCHPSVAFAEDGQIYVQWRNSLSGNRDMYLAISKDSGKTFGKAKKLGGGNWPLDACPMDGGAISISGKKAWSTWRRQDQVYLVEGNDSREKSLGKGEQPWLTATKDGTYIVWLKKRGEDALLLVPGKSSPTILAHHAFEPVIVTGPGGKGPIVTAWETREGKNTAVFCQVVKE
jgi:hypothetical protein